MFNTWKTVFIYINIFLSDPPLIRDTFVSPRVTIWTPNHLFGTVKSMFFKIRVFLVITRCGKKKRNMRLLVWCAGVAVYGCLLVVSVCLLVVCSRLLVVSVRFLAVCGGLLVVCGCLRVICGRLSSLPVLKLWYKISYNMVSEVIKRGN